MPGRAAGVIGPIWRAAMLALPFAAAGFDYFENARIAAMLLRGTDVDPALVASASFATQAKSLFGLLTEILVVVLGGITTATALVNVWPAALVAGISLLVHTPVSKGTIRAIVGIVAFPTAWIVAAVLTADGFLACSLVVLSAAVGAIAAVWLVERAVALTLMLIRWRAQLERIGTIEQAEALRAEVVATTRKAAGL